MNAQTQTASARLLRSREHLRSSLQAAAAPAMAGVSGAAGAADCAGAPTGPTWLDALKNNPGARILIDVVRHWWAEHPLRLAAVVAAAAATAALKPLAQRHPLGLVAGAAVVGGLIVWCRPWRWAKPALLAGLLPQLMLAAVRAAPIKPDSASAP